MYYVFIYKIGKYIYKDYAVSKNDFNIRCKNLINHGYNYILLKCFKNTSLFVDYFKNLSLIGIL